MAFELQDRTSDALYRGDELEFLLDDDKNVGEVYLDGDLIFQADEVFTEDQLRREFQLTFEIIEAAPESERSDIIDESDIEYELGEHELEISPEEEIDLEERLYTKGGEYAVADDMGNLREFIGDYHIHPKMGAMAGKFHDGRVHPVLVELGFEELDRIRKFGLEPITKIDYTVDEQIDPDYDDMSHEGSIMEDMQDMEDDRGDFY